MAINLVGEIWIRAFWAWDNDTKVINCLLRSYCSILLAPLIFSLSCYFFTISSFDFSNFLKIQTLINTANLPSELHTWLSLPIIGIHEHKNHWSFRHKSESSYVMALEVYLKSFIRGTGPFHCLVLQCSIHCRSWLRLCPRWRGTEEDIMHQIKSVKNAGDRLLFVAT